MRKRASLPSNCTCTSLGGDSENTFHPKQSKKKVPAIRKLRGFPHYRLLPSEHNTSQESNRVGSGSCSAWDANHRVPSPSSPSIVMFQCSVGRPSQVPVPRANLRGLTNQMSEFVNPMQPSDTTRRKRDITRLVNRRTALTKPEGINHTHRTNNRTFPQLEIL